MESKMDNYRIWKEEAELYACGWVRKSHVWSVTRHLTCKPGGGGEERMEVVTSSIKNEAEK